MHHLFLLSLVCRPLFGCATTIGLPVEDRTRVYADDFDTVFKAAVRALHEEGYPLYEVDYLGGVIETGEMFDASRGELSRVLASVSEWEDGTRLTLIYILEDAFDTAAEFLIDCGADHARVRYVARRDPPFVYHCERRVLYWESYHMPSLKKSQVRTYYTNLFTQIEAMM